MIYYKIFLHYNKSYILQKDKRDKRIDRISCNISHWLGPFKFPIIGYLTKLQYCYVGRFYWGRIAHEKDQWMI